MAIEPETVPTSAELPSRADVVVIGGGIIGTGTALFLARQGLSVVLLEKGIVAGEQSGQNWGWCRVQGRDPAEIPLMQRSLELWDEMHELTGRDVGFRRTGSLHVADTDKQIAALRSWHDKPSAASSGTLMVGSDEIAELLPRGSRRFAGGMFTAADGGAEPQRAAPALGSAAIRAGASVIQNCAVLGLVRKGDGRVTGVTSERGTIESGEVVLAGGHWSSLLLRTIGLKLPQLRLLSSVIRTPPVEQQLRLNVVGPGFSLRPRIDGGYTVSAGLTVLADAVPDVLRYLRHFLPVIRDREAYGAKVRFGPRFVEEIGYGLRGTRELVRTRRLEPPPYRGHLDALSRSLPAAIPSAGPLRAAESWAGYFDVTPDALPVISRVEGTPGLTISTGYSGHGFGLGPGAAELTSDIVLARTPRVDPSPFRLERFS